MCTVPILRRFYQLNSTWNASDVNATLLVNSSESVLSDVGYASLRQGSMDVELPVPIAYSIVDNEGSFVLEVVNNGSTLESWSVQVHPPVVSLRVHPFATESIVAGVSTCWYFERFILFYRYADKRICIGY